MSEDDKTMATQLQAVLARYHVCFPGYYCAQQARTWLDACTEDQLLVNWYTTQIKRSDWILPAPIYTTILTTSYGAMRHSTAGNSQIYVLQERREASCKTSCQARCMYGEGSAGKEWLPCVILKRLWHLHYTAIFLKGHVCPLYEKSSLFLYNCYCFMQDNDPKHMSHVTCEFFASINVNWWHTPHESPDMNPIENLWHELRGYTMRWNLKTRTS